MTKRQQVKDIWKLLLIFTLLFYPMQFAFSQYAAGDTAANFILNDINGNSVSLYNSMGDVVLLFFFQTT